MKVKKNTGFLLSILLTGFLFDLQSQEIEALMQMSIDDIMNTQIYSASKKSENIFDSPVSSSVLTKEEILNAGVTSIMEAMRLIPGVIVREQTNGMYDIHIRGFDNIPPNDLWSTTVNNITLVMVDNRIVYNYLNGGIFWEFLSIDLIDVERIEVVRGPASALYGPNAVAGVINIITRKTGKEGLSVSGHAQAGNYNTQIGNMAIGYKQNTLSTRISANFQKRNRYESEYYILSSQTYGELPDSVMAMDTGQSITGLRTQYPDPDLSMNRYGINASLNYHPGENIHFDLSSGYQDSRVQNLFVDIGAINFKTEDAYSKYVNFTGKIHRFTTRASLTTGEYEWLFGDVNPNKYKTLDTEVEYNMNISRLSIRPGISYKNAEYEFTGMKGKQSISTVGFALRTDYQGKAFRLVAALRGDKYSAPEKIYPSYQLAAIKNLGANHLIRAVVSKANRAAFLADIYFYMDIPLPPFIGNSMLLIGNENLKMLIMDMAELGYRAKLIDAIQVDLEIFHAQTKDYDDIFPNGTTKTMNERLYDILQYQNLKLRVIQNGATFSITWMPIDRLQARGFITLQKTDLKDYAPDRDNNPNATENREHKQTPAYFGGIVITYQPISRLNLNLNCYYYGKQTFDHQDHQFTIPDLSPGTTFTLIHDTEIESKILMNFALTYHLHTNIDLFFSIRNILGEDSQEFGFAENTDRLYLAGLRFEY